MSEKRVFVTGATGYLGSAIAARLVRAGHEVWGLSRSADRAKALTAIGVQPVAGTLQEPNTFLHAMKNCDSVVHTALDSEGGAAEHDQLALDAVRSAALDGRVRRLLYTSGLWVMGDGVGQVIDEHTPHRPLPIVRWLEAHEQIAFDLSTHEVDTIVLRPGVVYGEARGVTGRWFAQARDKKSLTLYGHGSNRWPMVHRDDVADAYVLAFEHAHAGDAFLLVDESHHTQRELADAVAAATGATVKALPAADVQKKLGHYGDALMTDLRATAAKARRELGWVPRHTSFVAEAPALWREWLEAREAPVA